MNTTGSARPNRTTSRVALCLVLAALTPGVASAVPGAPDTTFGPGGIRIDPAVLQLIREGNWLETVTTLSGNRIAVMTGYSWPDAGGRGVARYLATGLPDTGFASAGHIGFLAWVDSSVQPPPALFTPPVIARDGTMVTESGGRLVRYAPNGVQISATPTATRVVPLALTPDGRIVARIDTPIPRVPATSTVALFMPDGTRDPSFVPVVTGDPFGVAVKVARGSVWVAWRAVAKPSGYSVRLVRRPLDGGAGMSSSVKVQSPSTWRKVGVIRRILVGPRGTATLVGYARVGRAGVVTDQILLIGVTATGSLDRDFGSSGLVTLPYTASAARQRDGRIVVAWTRYVRKPSEHHELRVRRLTTSGHLDQTFPARRFANVGALVAGMDLAIDDVGRTVIGVGSVPPESHYGGLMLIRLRAR